MEMDRCSFFNTFILPFFKDISKEKKIVIKIHINMHELMCICIQFTFCLFTLCLVQMTDERINVNVWIRKRKV